MIRLSPLLICLFFTACTVIPPRITRDTLPSLFLPLEPRDSICLFEAFGETKFSVKGQRFGAHIELQWRGDSDFNVGFYSPFGGRIASIAPACGGFWDIKAGDSLYKKLPHENMDLGQGFIEYPFTYAQFMHILTGGLLDYAILKKNADSLSFDGKRGFCYWHNESIGGREYDIIAIINRKQSRVTDVIYRTKSPAVGELAYSSFKDGVPKEIRFSDPNNNYFYVNYERIFQRTGAQCQK